jgi:methylthioribulose 1-phosphate dehydratase / enolase-phosphatase E1
MISLHSFYMKGHIWRTGFECQEIKGVVFDDVPPALERWHASGIKVLAPPLLTSLYIAHSEARYFRISTSIMYTLIHSQNPTQTEF